MGWRRILIAVCVVHLACESPRPVAPTPEIPARNLALNGRVIDAATGDPLAGANIYILHGENRGRFGSTDATGAFTLGDLKPGPFTIEVAMAGYNAVQQELTLSADSTMSFPLSRIVPRRFVLSGRATDVGTGAPLSGAVVAILDGPDAGREASTGGDGAFNLTDVTFGGFTIRARLRGYDSVFQGVRLTGDTSLDIRMRRANESLAGTWTGSVSYASGGGFTIPEFTMQHSGAIISGSGGSALFDGTLRDPSAIGATTEVTGTLTLRSSTGGRNPMPCDGTGSFTGTVNWTRLAIVAPKVTYACGGENTVTVSLIRQQ